jgi:hypothetical protein
VGRAAGRSSKSGADSDSWALALSSEADQMAGRRKSRSGTDAGPCERRLRRRREEQVGQREWRYQRTDFSVPREKCAFACTTISF